MLRSALKEDDFIATEGAGLKEMSPGVSFHFLIRELNIVKILVITWDPEAR